MHHGSVRASSEGLGHGSTFVVQLPALAMAEAHAAHPDVSHLLTSQGPVTRRRILIVDDNADAAESTAMLLSLDGHEVAVAVDGPSALERAKDFRPDVVLLDIGLPEMDGYDVARRLRAAPWFVDTMLIAHSVYAGVDHVERVRQAGFDHHLVKPASIEQLNDLIASLSDPERSPHNAS